MSRFPRLAVALVALTAASCNLPSRTRTVTVEPLRPDIPQGQALVDGTLTIVQGTDVVGPALAPPFTIDVPARGEGGAEVTHVNLKDGSLGTIVWDGGRPLPLSGTGTLDLGPAAIEISGAGIRWSLDGGPRVMTAGDWKTTASVAAGTEGIAKPQDGATFKTGEDSVLLSHGGAYVVLPLDKPLHLEGPGALVLQGSLVLTTANEGEVRAGRARFGPGPFTLDLTPGPDGIHVKGVLQGVVHAS